MQVRAQIIEQDELEMQTQAKMAGGSVGVGVGVGVDGNIVLCLEQQQQQQQQQQQPALEQQKQPDRESDGGPDMLCRLTFSDKGHEDSHKGHEDSHKGITSGEEGYQEGGQEGYQEGVGKTWRDSMPDPKAPENSNPHNPDLGDSNLRANSTIAPEVFARAPSSAGSCSVSYPGDPAWAYLKGHTPWPCTIISREEAVRQGVKSAAGNLRSNKVIDVALLPPIWMGKRVKV